MREIIKHMTCAGGICNAAIRIYADDRDPSSGASHSYTITVDRNFGLRMPIYSQGDCYTLSFQKGPTRDAGVNGISVEALLAICMDRLEGFQTGELPHEANQEALVHIHGAMAALYRRTRERMAAAMSSEE